MEKFDWNKPTVQMLGRWQPWHSGHRALFEKAHAKTGQVAIMIRDTPRDNNNPFDIEKVSENIKNDLKNKYKFQKDYIIMVVPNIVNITYGRKVGYKIEQEHLGEEIENVSATKIRQQILDQEEKFSDF